MSELHDIVWYLLSIVARQSGFPTFSSLPSVSCWVNLPRNPRSQESLGNGPSGVLVSIDHTEAITDLNIIRLNLTRRKDPRQCPQSGQALLGAESLHSGTGSAVAMLRPPPDTVA